MQISNQGDKIAFRHSKENVAQFVSDTAEEIQTTNLLKDTDIKQEELRAKLSFDITINLVSKISYKTTLTVDLPTGDIIHNEKQTVEITNFDDVVFKRVES